MQNRIDEVLKAQGKTYEDMVSLTGLSNYVIGDIAHGRDEATLGAWLSLARALHVSPAYLVGWSNEPNDDKAWQFRQEERRKFKAWVKEHIANEPKMKIDVPDHGLKYTLDDGRVFYVEDIDELDAIREASVGKFIWMGNGYIATSHIVSIEKVGED